MKHPKFGSNGLYLTFGDIYEHHFLNFKNFVFFPHPSMQELKRCGYIIPVKTERKQLANYLPYLLTHQAKPRAVFDGSAAWKERCINDIIYFGPDGLNWLYYVLCSFPFGQVRLDGGPLAYGCCKFCYRKNNKLSFGYCCSKKTMFIQAKLKNSNSPDMFRALSFSHTVCCILIHSQGN